MNQMSNSAALPRYAMTSAPSWIRVGRGTYPFSSYGAASDAYLATIGRLGLGCSQTPRCELLDAHDRVVAIVAYNGRVFSVGPDGEAECANVLHEPPEF